MRPTRDLNGIGTYPVWMESQVRVSLDGEGHTLDVDKVSGPE